MSTNTSNGRLGTYSSIRHIIHQHKNLSLLSREIRKFERKTFEKLSTGGKNLIYTKNLQDLALAVGASFINILIWRKTGNFTLIILYNLAQYLAMYVSYSIPTFFISVRKRSVLQIALFTYLLMFISLIGYTSFNIYFIIAIGFLNGLAMGFFWVSYHSLIFEFTKDENRDTFFALDAALAGMVSIVSPAIISLFFLGTLQAKSAIPAQSYLYLFVFTIVLLLITFIFTFRLPAEYFQRLKLSDFKKLPSERIWGIVILRELIDGFREGSEDIIAGLLLFFILSSELNISFLNTIVAILGIFVSLKLASVLSRNNRLIYGGIGSVLFLLARIFYVQLFSINGIVIAVLIGLVANPFFGLGLVSTYYGIVDHLIKKGEDYIKYIYIREIPVTLGRVFGALLILFLIHYRNDVFTLKSLYLIIGVLPLLYFILTYIVEKGLTKTYKKSLAN